MLSFDPSRPPTAPRPAATVVIVRPGVADGSSDRAGGVEIFCVVRHQRSGFLGGAVVFPGGKVDPSDGEAALLTQTSGLPARAQAIASDDTTPFALCIAACREMLEEAGIIPLAGLSPDAAGATAAALRSDLLGGSALSAALARHGVRVDLEALEPFARWVTPEAEQRRFDARFFLLALPDGQEATHDRHETTDGFWATPTEILRRFGAGEIFLAPPTTRTLELLGSVTGIDAAREWARAQPLEPVCPHFSLAGDVPTLALPGDPAHPIAERRIGGSTRFVLRDGRFVSEDAPPREPVPVAPRPETDE